MFLETLVPTKVVLKHNATLYSVILSVLDPKKANMSKTIP